MDELEDRMEEKVPENNVDLSSKLNEKLVGDPLNDGFYLGMKLIGTTALQAIPYVRTGKIGWSLLNSGNYSNYKVGLFIASSVMDLTKIIFYTNLLS